MLTEPVLLAAYGTAAVCCQPPLGNPPPIPSAAGGFKKAGEPLPAGRRLGNLRAIHRAI